MDILEFVRNRLLANAAIVAACPGGIRLQRSASQLPARPYVMIDFITGESTVATEPGWPDASTIQLSVFADSSLAARAVKDLITDDLDALQQVPMGPGRVEAAIRQPEGLGLDDLPSSTGGRVAMSTVDYVFVFSRS
jgi:hypothetical protein